MKRLVLGAAAAGGGAFAAHRLVRHGRAMHGHCREMMRDRCGGSSVDASSEVGATAAPAEPCAARCRPVS